MALLPAGFTLPPLPYLLGLLAGLAALAVLVRRRRPSLDERHVVGLAPWMVAGAVGHVLYVREALPAIVRPLGGAPTVYGAVALAAGAVWLVADAAGRDAPRALAVTGTVAVVPLFAQALVAGATRGALSPFWSGVGLLAAGLVGGLAWALLRRLRPGVEVTGRAGPLALFGHALDGVSTAVGIDVLQYGERSPLSRLIIEVGRDLPTAEMVGAGWLFVVVKVLVAAAVVVALADLVRDEPTEGNALLALVIGVGLGPGVHNLLLFAVS